MTAENDVMVTKAAELAGPFSVSGFRAKYMIVITWYRMEQNISPPAPSQVSLTTPRKLATWRKFVLLEKSFIKQKKPEVL